MTPIIVGVPGPWRERSDLMHALVDAHGARYVFAGQVFMDVETEQGCVMEWEEHDERLRASFAVAGAGRLSEAEVDGIQAHRSVIYLLFSEPGLESLRLAVRFVGALLRSGGLGAKVETAGLAQPRERWLQEADPEDLFHLYTLFVQLVRSGDIVYTCGMHNFASPDAAVPATMDHQEGAELLTLFNLYRIAESPSLADGETFGVDKDAPWYRMTHEPYVAAYDPKDPLHNPHGLWMLRPAGKALRRRWSWNPFRSKGPRG